MAMLFLRNYPYFSPGALKQIDFARSHVTAANDQHRTLFQIGEYW